MKNEHDQISDLLPLYVSGALDRDQRRAVEQHLTGCAACCEDLALWAAMAGEIEAADQGITAPRDLASRALEGARKPRANAHSMLAKLRRAGLLLRSQIPLVQRELWPASAAVIGLGYVASLIAAQSGFIYALAPMIAAACVSLIFGPDQDPAFELALSTPTSPRQILLARLALVFGYNLAVVLVATLGLLPVMDTSMLGSLLLAWLAPMTFLSMAALVLSLWVGASNAISITYVAWLIQLFTGPLSLAQPGVQLSPWMSTFIDAYQTFWESPILLLALSAPLLLIAVWMAGRQHPGLFRTA
jgi:hypothetical protein